MKIVIITHSGRLTATVEESSRHEPTDLIANTPTDPRAAELTAALVGKLVGLAVHDAIIREAGGTDGA
jgi:hypothetical protein